MERKVVGKEPSAPSSEPEGAPPRHDSEAPPADKGAPKYQHRATVAAKAFRGLFWMVTTGVGSRIVSLISTLLLTRYVLPEDYGEVQNTFIVCWMVDLVMQLGLPQYVATRADITPKQIHQATIYYHLLGTAALLLTWALAPVIGPRVGAPHMSAFMPGFVLAISLSRLATMPDRILVRQLRFRASSALRAGSEVTYALVSLGLAASSRRFDFTFAGHAVIFGGGFAIVWGNVARGLFRSVATIAVTKLRDWFAIVRLDRGTARELFSFGVPITIAGLGSIGARRWDNLVIANLYGSAASGIYNLAYNVADVPPSVVGESLGDVLAPTFANTAPADRSRELVRWVGVSALVCFPLGVGLSAVAPSISWMFGDSWYSAVPMIILLGSLSLTRPIIGTIFAYLQALGMGRTLMVLEWGKAIGIVVVMLALGHAMRAFASPASNYHFGPNLACAAVGGVMVASTLSYQFVGAKAAGIAPSKLIGPLFRPLLACVPMVLAVLAVRFLFGPVTGKPLQILRLTCEVLAGAAAFIAGAFVIARSVTKDLIELLKSSLAKRRGGGE
jgi:lipopolysaccharide exporter